MKLPDFRLRGIILPRPVAISVFVIVAAGVLISILVPTLGAARDDAITDNVRLLKQVPQTTAEVGQARADYDYVVANQQKFEELLQGDRLVPHSRRAAARQLQALAEQYGLTNLSYDMATVGEKSAAAVTSQVQPQAAAIQAYRVNVENIDLKIGAPIDGQIYRFLVELGRNFPGAAIIQSVSLDRPAKVTDEDLSALSKGTGGNLVKGEVKILWRTAQANDAEKKAP